MATLRSLFVLWLAVCTRTSSAGNDNDATVATILADIDARQNPDVQTCSSRRLLLLNYPSDVIHGDGLAQLLLRIVLGLGEAAYADRTLIWGAELPLLFDAPMSLLRGGHHWDDGSGLALNCSAWRGGGGAYNCVYQRLSTCSLADVTQAELADIGQGGGLRDSARVKVQESRRGPVAFMPTTPFRAEHDSITPRARHRWAGALAAYATRLVPNVSAIFEARRAALGLTGPYWSLHRRHGDVAATPGRYGSRRVFTFRSFMEAASDAAAAAAAEGGQGVASLPTALYVASDDPSTDGIVRVARKWLASGEVAWPAGARRPRIIAAPSTRRLRTAGGTHVAALADVGTGRSEHMARVFLEAAEDLWLLGGGELFIGTGCSGYSALAALLVAAHTNGDRVQSELPSSPIFLDGPELASGELQSGFLPGTFYAFSRTPAQRGSERWDELEARFTSASMVSYTPSKNADEETALFERLVPSAPRPGIARDGLPLIDVTVIDAETRCWRTTYATPHVDISACSAACTRLLPENGLTPELVSAAAALDAVAVSVNGDTSAKGASADTPTLVAQAALLSRRGSAWGKRTPSKAFTCFAAEAAALDACSQEACADARAVTQARAEVTQRVQQLSRLHLEPYSTLSPRDLEALIDANVGRRRGDAG